MLKLNGSKKICNDLLAGDVTNIEEINDNERSFKDFIWRHGGERVISNRCTGQRFKKSLRAGCGKVLLKCRK